MIFRPKCDAVVAGCIKLYKDNHNLYSSLIIIIREDEMGRACSVHGDKRNVYKS
jgi:hypothetical protein